MKQAIIDFIGSYQPITYDVEYALADGSIASYEVVASGMAGVDWPWIFAALIILVMLYCIWRFVGAVCNG